MNAHGFYKEFMHRICDTPELMKAYKNCAEYTKLIIPLINGIIEGLEMITDAKNKKSISRVASGFKMNTFELMHVGG